MGKTKYKYYDNGDIARIQRMVAENKLEAAAAGYANYIAKYPNEPLAQDLYADVLIKLGKFKEARDLLEQIKFKDRLLEDSIRKARVLKTKLLRCEERYEEALSVLEKNRVYFEDYIGVLLFLKKKLNLLTDEDYQYTGYLFSQIVDYSEERCLDHLLKHQYYEGNNNLCQFAKNFPLRNIYFRLRRGLPEQGRLYSSCCDYKVMFKYDNNGRVNGRMTNYFEVVVLNHSNDIITMYPYLNTERRPYTDITPEITEIEHPKVKRMSQIDKFNQRYQK